MAGLISAIGRGISAAAGMGSELYAKGAIEDQRAKMQAERDMRLEELQNRRDDRNRTNAVTDAAAARKVAIDNNIADAASIEAEATGLANTRRGTNLDQARAIYERSGMSQSDINLGLGAVDEARKGSETATRQDRTQAGLKLGLIRHQDAAAQERAEEALQHSRGEAADNKIYSREQDAKTNARQDKQDARAERLTNAQIGNMAAAASDRASGKADKKALKEAYTVLGQALADKAANPKVDYSRQIAAAAVTIASNGGNPATMIDLVLGKEGSKAVTTTTGGGLTDQPEVKTTVNVRGDRQGGAMDAGKPASTGDGKTKETFTQAQVSAGFANFKKTNPKTTLEDYSAGLVAQGYSIEGGAKSAAVAPKPASAPPEEPGTRPVAQTGLIATDPMQTKLNIENREINDMKRTKFSPDVQAWLDDQDAKKKADQAAYLQREKERSLTRSRELTRN